MTEPEFLRLVGSIRGITDPAFFDLPLEDAPFDSLDLLALRAALEVRLGRNLSDERFMPRSTLRDLYELVST
jgi:acyl carrier protein